MANKQNLTLDDYGLGDNFSDATMDFSAPPVKGGKRSAVLDLGKIAAKGAVSGVTDGAFIRKMVKQNMHEGYGTALDFADETATTFKSLYNTAATEMRPITNDLKRATQRLMPTIGGAMPGPIKRRLEEWSRSTDEMRGYSQEDAHNAQIQQAQQEIFQYEFKQRQDDRLEGKAKEEIKEGIEQARFTTNAKILNQISLSTQRLAMYQEKVTANYQRKMLELSYRQVFLLRDTHEEQKRLGAVMTEGLRAIVRNTGLPDYEKLSEKNRAGSFIRNQFAGMASGGLRSARMAFMSKLRASAEAQVKQRVGNFVNHAQTALFMGNQLLDGRDQMNEMRESMAGLDGMDTEPDYGFTGIAAGMGGGWLGQMGAGKAMRWAKQYLDKNPNIVKRGNQAQAFFENLPQYAHRFANSDMGEGRNRILDMLLGLGKDTVRDALKQGPTNLHRSDYSNLQDAAVFTNQANKSITEIIPGYLARILREISVFRTGDTKTALTVYDFQKNRFDTQSNSERNALGTAFSSYGMRDMKERTDNIARMVEDPDNPFTSEEKKALADHLLKLHRRGGGIADKETLGKSFNYRGAAEPYGEKFSSAFNRYFGDDADNSRHVAMARQVNTLSIGVEERKAVIQNLANAGHLEMLKRAGIVDATGENIDMDRFYALHLEDDPVMAAIGEQLETVAPSKSRRRISGLRPAEGRLGRRSRGGVDLRQVGRAAPAAPAAASTYEFQGPPRPSLQQDSARPSINWSDAQEPITKATERLHEDLLRIESLVQAGTKITVARLKIQGVPIPDLDKISDHIDSLSESGKAHLGKAKNFFDRTLREHYRAAKDTIQTRGQQGWDFVKENAPKARDFAQDQFENLRDRGRRGWGKFQDTKNVYLPGEKMPRLMTAKLKAGEYLDDATGKVLTSYKDIRGAVRDKITDEIVLTDDEAKSAFVRFGPVQRLLSAMGAVINPIKSAAERALDRAHGAMLNAAALARKGVQKLKDYLDGPQDVYVTGEQEPVMLARIMRAGGYRLKADPTKVVSKITEISGPILDSEGNEVLSMEDLRRGIYDKYGRPLQTGWMRGAQIVQDYTRKYLNSAKDKLIKGLRQAKDAGMVVGRKAASAAKGGWEAFVKWIGTDGIIISGGKKIVDRLTEIRDFLYERFDKEDGPSKYKRGSIRHRRPGVAGGRDDDGLRDGSAEDIRIHRAQAKEEARKEKEEKELADIDKELGTGGPIVSALAALSKKMGKGDHKGLLDSLMEGGIGGLAETLLGKLPGGKLLGKAGGLLKKIPGVGGMLSGGSRLLSKVPGLGRLMGRGGAGLVSAEEAAMAESGLAGAGMGAEVAAKSGLLSRAGSVLGRGAGTVGGEVAEHGLLGGATRLAGKGAWQVAKLLPRGLWEGGKLALKGGQFLLNARKMGGPLGFLLGGAGDAFGGLVMDGLGAAASGLMSVLASPVVLGAAAVGLAGYGGYKLYKWAKNHKSLDPVNSLRYAQYGFLPTDKDHVQAVFQLEDMLYPNVHYDSKGMASLNLKKIVPHDLFDLFGIDKKDNKQISNFATWFVKRFKPVFLTHLTIAHKLGGITTLAAVDKLKGEQMREYINGAKFPDGPYDVRTSPFADLEKLPAGASDVAKAAETALKSVDSKGNNKSVKRAVDGKGILPGRTVAPAGAQPALDAKGKLVAMALTNNLKDPTARAAGQTAKIAGQVVAGTGLDPTKGVDAMTAVRMKTYGLTNMEPEKVQVLLQMEKAVEDRLTVQAATGPQSGNNQKVMQAVYQGDDMSILHMVGSRFDVIGDAGDGAFAWRRWFGARFLPTYLAYRGALSTQTGQTKKQSAENQLVGSPAQAVMVAQAVVGAQSASKYGGGSVWKQKMSPWPKYDLNADPSTTKENIQALNAHTGRTHLPEAKAKLVQKAKSSAKQEEKKTDKPGVWDSIKKTASDVWNSVKNTAGNMWQGAKDAASSAGKAVSNTANSVWDATKSAANTAWSGVKSAGSYVAQKVTASAAAIKASLLKALAAAGITQPTEQAMFMAQMDTESGGFKSLNENLNYQPERLYQVFPKYFNGPADAAQVAQGGPEAIANRIYGNRMGNKDPGDGFKYRGRGVIQLTGKANYEKFGQILGIDLVNNPDMASDPAVASKIAIAYWKNRVPEQAAQQGDVKSVTKAINGGYNGLADRQSKFQMYLQQAKSGQLAAAAGAAGGAAAAGAPGSSTDAQAKATGAAGSSSTPAVPAAPTTAAASKAIPAPSAGGATSDPMAQAKAVAAAAPAPKASSGSGSSIASTGPSSAGMPTVVNPVAPAKPSSTPVARDTLTQDMSIPAEQLKTLKSIEAHLADIKQLVSSGGKGAGAQQASMQSSNTSQSPSNSLAQQAQEMTRGPIEMGKRTFGIT
jgi:predicted chitinase